MNRKFTSTLSLCFAIANDYGRMYCDLFDLLEKEVAKEKPKYDVFFSSKLMPYIFYENEDSRIFEKIFRELQFIDSSHRDGISVEYLMPKLTIIWNEIKEHIKYNIHDDDEKYKHEFKSDFVGTPFDPVFTLNEEHEISELYTECKIKLNGLIELYKSLTILWDEKISKIGNTFDTIFNFWNRKKRIKNR